ncbi:MAG: hypothetical protein ACRDY1_06925, partial [Acidimicrobiales bacterium]
VAPTGNVVVSDTATMTAICSAPLVAAAAGSSTGSCRPDDTAFPSGTFFTSVAAGYGGDGNFAGSASQPRQSFAVTDPGSGGPSSGGRVSALRFRGLRRR